MDAVRVGGWQGRGGPQWEGDGAGRRVDCSREGRGAVGPWGAIPEMVMGGGKRGAGVPESSEHMGCLSTGLPGTG